MKNEKSVSRRNFLAAGSAVVASSVLISAPDAKAETKAETKAEELIAKPVNTPPLAEEVVTTTARQTLENKTISAESNNLIIGTEYLNIRQMPGFPSGVGTDNDITAPLTNAINRLKTFGTRGGQILIPRGLWTSSGGHDLGDSTSVEGVGVNSSTGTGEQSGTEIQMKPGGSHMFRIGGPGERLNCSIKNLVVRMNNNPTATGLLMTTNSGQRIYGTYLENVQFWGGDYAIKVITGAGLENSYRGPYNAGTTYQVNDLTNIGATYYRCISTAFNQYPATSPAFWEYAASMGNFECILNVFNRVTLGCRVGLYCETNNSGFEFNTPYIYLPLTADAVAFYCYIMGSLTVNNYLAVSNPPGLSTGPTLLYTVGAYNTILFQNGGQDENVRFLYRNALNNYSFAPIVFRSCLIQSEIKITANSSFVSDSNTFVNFIGSPNFKDSPTGWCKLYLMGKNAVQTRDQNQNILYGQEVLQAFSNPNSAVINPFNAPLGY
jgi:hypothetical protein